jgi:hypothetical protein
MSATIYAPTEAREHTEWVVLRWSVWDLDYVGPFADGEAAAAWAIEYETADLNWHTQRVDPTVPLQVRDPGPMPPLLEPGPYDGPWLERQGDVGDFFVMMTGSEPLHLVGPFPDHQHAYSWGLAQEQRGDGDDGWQVVWLEDTDRVPVLRSPADCEA